MITTSSLNVLDYYILYMRCICYLLSLFYRTTPISIIFPNQSKRNNLTRPIYEAIQNKHAQFDKIPLRAYLLNRNYVQKERKITGPLSGDEMKLRLIRVQDNSAVPSTYKDALIKRSKGIIFLVCTVTIDWSQDLRRMWYGEWNSGFTFRSDDSVLGFISFSYVNISQPADVVT